MKCINCGTDNNLRDRTANQGQCIQCQHPFAFEPTSINSLKITILKVFLILRWKCYIVTLI